MFLDNENTDSETSVEVGQQVNEETSDNTILGILTFNIHIHKFSITKHINTYLPMLVHGICQ